MTRTCAVVLHASLGESLGERLVEEGREASTRDLVETLLHARLEGIFAVTPDEEFGRSLAAREVVVRRSDDPFHFGRSLKELVAIERIEGLLYFGSGSGVLLSDFERARSCGLRGADRTSGVVQQLLLL